MVRWLRWSAGLRSHVSIVAGVIALIFCRTASAGRADRAAPAPATFAPCSCGRYAFAAPGPAPSPPTTRRQCPRTGPCRVGVHIAASARVGLLVAQPLLSVGAVLERP